MIDVFYAPSSLQKAMSHATNERALLSIVMDKIDFYYFASQVETDEIDLAYAAAGGQSRWVNADKIKIRLNPTPQRVISYGDILVELPKGFVNLATPAGFIPLVDIIYSQGLLSHKRLN